jgi:hypothetical protein
MTNDLAELMPELMNRATDTVPADTAHLVRNGLKRGVALARRRRRRVALACGGLGLAASVTVAAVLSGLPGRHTVVDGGAGPAGVPPSDLRMLTEKDLVDDLTALLPGTSSDQSVKQMEGETGVEVTQQLTNPAGRTGYVSSAFGLGDPPSPEQIASQKAMCRQMQEKVGPRDGTDCVVVATGTIEFWDDTVTPEDMSGLAPGTRMTYVHYNKWDGSFAGMQALNTTEKGASAEPRTPPVIRTAAMVELVQDLEWYVSTGVS